jgi:EAL domain-containing protein (putative c-di-GMP-specific phosphodiesterase class I)
MEATLQAAANAAPGSAEEALMRFVMRMGAERQSHVAIQFHLSRITRAHRNGKHLSIAANLLREMLGPMLHGPFVLRDGDIVVVRRPAEPDRLNEAVETLRYLFAAEAPLAEGGLQPYTLFQLETEHLILLQGLLRLSEAEDRRVLQGRRQVTPRPAGPLLPPAEIGTLMQRIGKLELANYLRHQTVWSFGAPDTPRPMFDELYVSVAELSDALGLAPEMAKDPQVFGLITRAFDKYVLATLLKDHAEARRPISININLQSLLSSEFLEFESQRHARWRGQIILEMQFANIWSDLESYFAVTQSAREDGFGCCIDGVTYQALPLANLRRLEADFVKLIWDDAMLSLDETGLREICRAIKDCGTERVVLARCGREEALQFGLAASIRLFQGRYIDGAARELQTAPVAAA